MVSTEARVSVRIAVLMVLVLVAFYVGRPLYWKLSATIHDIRENRHSVTQGLSQLVLDAQRSVGWVHGKSDSGHTGDSTAQKLSTATRRRYLLGLHYWNHNEWPQ